MSLQLENELKDIKCVLLQSANLKFKSITFDNFISNLKRYYGNPEWNIESEYAKQFSQFKDFLMHKKLEYASELKVKLGSFDFTIYYSNIERKYTADVYAIVYPSMNIINVLYNIYLGDLSVDEAIFIRKVIQFDRKKIILNNNGFLKMYPEHKEVTFSELTQDIYKIFINLSRYNKYRIKYELSRLKKLSMNVHKPSFLDETLQSVNLEKMMLLEVRDIDGIAGVDFLSDEFNKRFSKKIFGILTCDEGYDFVPSNCVQAALDSSFGTREFFRVYASNIGVVLINLVNSDLQVSYETKQNSLAEYFDDKYSKLVCTHSNIAGLEHGVLIAMEQATNLLVIINANMKKDYFNNNRHIWRIIKNRRKLIEIVNITMSITMSEITNLTDLMNEKFGISTFVTRVRERLDLAEDDTLIIYQRWNNVLVLILTILGAFFAAMSISEIKAMILYLLNFIVQ